MRRAGRRTVTAAAIAAGAFAPPAEGAVVAAYEKYVTGSGFQIGLVNVSTGAQITLPPGVNTSADELHPTLSADGRQLAFMRTTLQPKLNGDIVPPAARSVFVVDRETGTTIHERQGASGPVLRGTSLAWGLTPFVNVQSQRTMVSMHATLENGTVGGTGQDIGTPPAGALTTHAAFAASGLREFNPSLNIRAPFPTRYLAYAAFDAATGAPTLAQVEIDSTRIGSSGFTEGSTRTFDGGSHPMPRSGDNYVALAKAGDVFSIAPDTETELSAAPAAITTTDPESMPAWSPNGVRLGFVRTRGTARRLHVFDTTPGIQGIVLSPAELGSTAPTPQTRAFQDAWGGVSLADVATSTTPLITCDSTCINRIQSTTSTPTLSPTVSTTTKVGIFVVRVTGKRKLLGKTVPRIKVVGRVPLGTARKARRARFGWDLRVDGRKLRAGTYLLTYRALKGERITALSGSIRIKVKGGRVVSSRRA